MPAKNFLKNLTIPSPCEADWDSMIGNDQVRFCQHCNLDVHNLSLMSRTQAELLVERAKGRLCVRYHHDARGKPLTLPVTQKLHRIGRRVSKIAAGAFSATLSVSSAVAQQTTNVQSEKANPPAATQPFARWTLTSSIAGTIKDQNGAFISGATISLSSENLSGALYTTTGLDGGFKVENLAPGAYRVRIEAPGFEAAEAFVFPQENAQAHLDRVLQMPVVDDRMVEGLNTRVLAFHSGGIVAFVAPEDPFIRAAQEDDLEALTALIAGVEVDKRDARSETTALEHAVRNANREMVQLLISSGAKVNAKNSSGQTVLMMLDSDATVDLIWDLINAGANVNLKDEDNNTALMRAVSSDNLEAVKALIETGAELNAQNKLGMTALMQAASEGNVNAVRALVNAGADINLLDQEGMNALGIAKDNDHAAVVRFLKSKGAAEVAKAAKEE